MIVCFWRSFTSDVWTSSMVFISHVMLAREPASKPAMLIEHLPLIATVTAVLCVFAFIADASSP
jgi:hypothetical protein